MTRFIRIRSFTPLALLSAGGAAALLATGSACAAMKSWTADSGSWNVGANWSPLGVPGLGDDVFIGNLFSVENEWVTLGQNASVASLSITDGMVLDTNGKTFAVTGETVISGYNTDGIFGYPSRLIVDDSAAATDCVLDDVSLADGAGIDIRNEATLLVNGFLEVAESTSVSGEGHLVLDGDGPVAMLVNGGVGAGTGGFVISQIGAGRIDLDGTVAGDHTLNVTLSKIDGSAFATLTINGDGLVDTFDEDVWLSAHNELTMNLSEGWSMGPATTLRVFGNSSFPGPAVIGGSELEFMGHLQMTGSDKQVQFNAPVTFAASASAELGADALAEINGNAVVDGGPWLLDDGADIDFNVATTVTGGEFVTFSANAADGSVDFNGQTSWNGDFSVVGVARQRGNASVPGPSLIEASRFDLDGDGATAWSIGNNLTIDAAYLDAGTQNIFDGSMSISGTFLGKLTVNLDAPSTHWTMNGTMELGGVGGLMATRVSGSEMRVTGDLDITGRVQITADTRLEDGAVTTMETPTSALRLSGSSFIESGAAFFGEGMIEVGAGGELTLDNPVSLGDLGLLNAGVLELGSSPGKATVHSFENTDSGTWIVEIGGYAPGLEYDFLTVSTGDALVDGTLDVEVIDVGAGLFQPQAGDSFTILAAPGTVSGAFDNSPVSFVPGKVYLWSVTTSPDEVAVHLDEIVPCPADLNGDGTVDGADLGLLLSAWGACSGCVADITVDGSVDGADLGLLLASWGPCQF